MPVRISLSSIAVFFAAMLLSGCVGEPQTFYAAEPVVPEPHVIARAPVRPAPAVIAPTLSADEKQRLFQDFQQLQGSSSQAAVARELAP